MAAGKPVTLVEGTSPQGYAPQPLIVVDGLPISDALQNILDDFEDRIEALENAGE